MSQKIPLCSQHYSEEEDVSGADGKALKKKHTKRYKILLHIVKIMVNGYDIFTRSCIFLNSIKKGILTGFKNSH